MVHGGQRPVAPTPPGTFYDSVLASSDSKNPPINFPLPVKAKSSRSIKTPDGLPAQAEAGQATAGATRIWSSRQSGWSLSSLASQ